MANQNQQTPSIRPLHWVLKVGDLKRSVEFFTGVCGFKVFRHEEFDKGCEATCNGPYSGWWSKTMIGPSSESHFCIELTYNYGVSSYKRGNDLHSIHLIGDIAAAARAHGYEVQHDQQGNFVIAPDDVKWYFHSPADYPNHSDEPFFKVVLNTANIQRAKDYYNSVLQMRVYGASDTHAVLGYAADTTQLELRQLPDNQTVNHEEAFGRIAFAIPDVSSIYSRVVSSGDSVLNAPITLSTPGKADVVVTILKDRDDNEICMVNEEGFTELSTPKPGDEIIDWEARQKRLNAQAKFQKMHSAN